MLRLLDARTDSYAEVKSALPGLLRVCAYAPGGTGISGLRVRLVADLLARIGELRGLQVLTLVVSSEHPPREAVASERDAGAFGIHPPAGYASPDEAQASLGGAIDVHIASHGADVKPGTSGLVVKVGAAHMNRDDDPAVTVVTNSGGGQRLDPLAVRLALMSFPYQQPADLTEDVLASARETLGDWRRQVAEWAESSSKPIPAEVAGRTAAAFSDLDTVSALSFLHGLACDDSMPAGAKFETFAYADRILGLDLAREIGQPRT